MRRACECVLASAVLALAAGCGPGPASVRGTVTLDGQPLGGAALEFFAAEGPPYQYPADAGADGRFAVVLASPSAGLAPGRYKVTVTKGLSLFAPPAAEEEPVAGSNRPGRNTLPARYARPETTPLEVTVGPGVNTFELSLTAR